MLGVIRFIIRLYQCTLSPIIRLLCGPDCGCRFAPSCSRYFLEAVEAHGVGYGSWLGLKRLARCQPWGGCGYDPVPERRANGSQAARSPQHGLALASLTRMAGRQSAESSKLGDLGRV